MPLVSVLGEQSINGNLGIDQPGFGVWLIPDSNLNLFGFVQEFVSSDTRVSVFFVQGDSGQVTERVQLTPDLNYNIAVWDQEAFLIYPVNGDSDAFPPTIFYAESDPFLFEGDISEYPPNYVFEDQNLFAVSGDVLVPVGRATQSSFANGIARVYTAPDGDGSGVFLEVLDSEGHRIGGIIRVNDDIVGDQTAPIVGGLDEAFTVAWVQEQYNGANTELYSAKTFNLDSNLDLAVTQNTATNAYSGDAGDYVTDIFFFDTAATETFSLERITNFGEKDIFVTTVPLFDSNRDGVITFGDNKRLEVSNDDSKTVASIAFSGIQALEFDGIAERPDDGKMYYVYSRVGSEADEFYLLI
jgi:hypothetical protein